MVHEPALLIIKLKVSTRLEFSTRNVKSLMGFRLDCSGSGPWVNMFVSNPHHLFIELEISIGTQFKRVSSSPKCKGEGVGSDIAAFRLKSNPT